MEEVTSFLRKTRYLITYPSKAASAKVLGDICSASVSMTPRGGIKSSGIVKIPPSQYPLNKEFPADLVARDYAKPGSTQHSALNYSIVKDSPRTDDNISSSLKRSSAF